MACFVTFAGLVVLDFQTSSKAEDEHYRSVYIFRMSHFHCNDLVYEKFRLYERLPAPFFREIRAWITRTSRSPVHHTEKTCVHSQQRRQFNPEISLLKNAYTLIPDRGRLCLCALRSSSRTLATLSASLGQSLGLGAAFASYQLEDARRLAVDSATSLAFWWFLLLVMFLKLGRQPHVFGIFKVYFGFDGLKSIFYKTLFFFCLTLLVDHWP